MFFLSDLGAHGDCTVSLLHAFAPLAPDGAYPWATMIQASNGNFYGTSVAGGMSDAGTIFQVTPAGVLTPIYSFANGIDGGNPRSSLVQGSDGNLYGTAEYGGISNAGTVFMVTTNGVFTSLYSFTNGIDGGSPYAALIEGTNGNFYGTASRGGSNGYGTVFEITPAGVLTTLHSFTYGSDGAEPTAPLIFGPDGNFYGTAAYGGTKGQGTVFGMTPAGVLTPLHSFTDGSDGALPWAPLALGEDNNFYGTTYNGGAYGYGTVFMITSKGALTPLYSFANGQDGGQPYAGLTLGPNGNFYGTTYGYAAEFAGTNSIGTIFEITSGGYLTTLYSFTNGIGGANPAAGLVLGNNANFYGAADDGGIIGWGGPLSGNLFGRLASGTVGWGTVFAMTPDGAFTNLCVFPGESDGANPAAGLIQGTNGLFYGTTERGGTNDDGTVFQMTADGTVTPLYSFTAGNDGAVPAASLTQGDDGNFYGTTCAGGPKGGGTIFKVTAAGVLTPLYAFTNGSDGEYPFASLVQGTNGNFYGTTSSGGAKSGAGTVFQLTTTGALSVLHTFTNGSDGASPLAGLVQGADGNLYGTTEEGGANGCGTIFKITMGGVLTPLYSFKNAADGSTPSAALALGSDRSFYGTCPSGGTNNWGTVFKITASGVLTPLYSFTAGNDGSEPLAPLTQGTDGKFYGTTLYGGANGCGTIFQITTNGLFASLYSFVGLTDGGDCFAAMLQAANGNFYLPMMRSAASGTVLRFTVPPSFLTASLAGGALQLSWSAEIGQSYQLQCSACLNPAVWSNLGSPTIANGPALSATDVPPISTQRFYRIVAIP